MHKLVILLTKAENKDEAISNAVEFLEPYGEGKVWDWYSIGGRWNNYLAPLKKVEKFKKWAKKKFPVLASIEGYAINVIENEEVKPVLQEMWEKEGLKGKNPFYASSGFSLGEDEPYNAVPLNKCINIVKPFVRDTEKEAEEYFEKIMESRKEEKEKGKGYSMSAYYAGLYKDAKYNNFCFDSNVYDITGDYGEAIPEDTAGYWAVVVDMHN